MSAKSIKAFAEAYPARVPHATLQERLRTEEKCLREYAGKILARANKLGEMAAELEPAAPPEPKCPACNATTLVFDQSRSVLGPSWCVRCKRCALRASQDGGAIFVYGYGRTKDLALADMAAAVERT